MKEVSINEQALENSVFSYNTASGNQYNIGPSNSSISSLYETDKWSHLVTTIEGTTIKFYKDGILEETRTDGVEPATMVRQRHMIGGAGTDGNVANTDATIAYVRFWN